MAPPSYDSAMATSLLLCAEDNISIFDDVENNNNNMGIIHDNNNLEYYRNHRNHIQSHGFFYGFGPFPPLQSDECLGLMVVKECDHLPATDYLHRLRSGDLDLGSRKEVIDWIVKVHAHFNFGPLCAYLSINYMDRFLSAYELPKGKAWMIQLLAVACLSLAAKMEESEVPLSLDLQVGESKFVFEARTIQRMELRVLSTLKWRMQAVTPFSYIDYFLSKVNGGEDPPTCSILESIQLILSTVKGIDFLEFRPSEVAAAVAISVLGDTQTVDFENAFSLLIQHVQKERVMKCIELIHDMGLSSGSHKGSSGSVPSVPQSPIGVIDAACLSYKSDETATTTTTQLGSRSNSSNTSPEAKRRKLG